MNFARLTREICRWSSRSVVSAVLGQLCICWIGLCGASPASLLMLMLGYAAGFLIVDTMRSGIHELRQTRTAALIASSATGLTVMAGSWLLPSLLNSTLLAGCETIPSTFPLAPVLIFAFPALMVALNTALCLAFHETGTDWSRWTDETSAVGCSAIVLLPHFWISLPLAYTVGALMVTTIAVRWLIQMLLPQVATMPFLPASSKRVAGAWIIALSLTGTGILMLAMTNMLARIIPANVPGLLIGVVVAASMLRLRHRIGTRYSWLLPPGIPVCLVAIACFPLLFNSLAAWNLTTVGRQESVITMGLIRGLQWGIVLGCAAMPSFVAARQTSAGMSRVTILSLLAGCALGLILMSRGVSAILMTAIGLILVSLPRVMNSFVNRTATEQRFAWTPWRTVGIAVACLMVTLMARPSFTRTASLMFSERTTAAAQRGLERDLIPYSDSSRLLAEMKSNEGDLSVWRQNNQLLEIRRNGVSLGRISTDTSVVPQPPEDILPAVFGFVSHPHPDRILLLGDETGVCLRTVSHFPIRDIVAIRSNSALTELVRQLTWQNKSDSPLNDARITIRHEPSLLALRRRSLKQFDVVVAATPPMQFASTPSEMTQEFYEAAKSRMTPTGVFCQRFRQSQLGAEPLKETLSTLLNVFNNAGAIQTVPGEVLLIASDAEKLIDPDLLSRLQRDHVQREIASTGWDWSQVAVLPLVDARDKLGLFSQDPRPQAITISNGHFVMTLPAEIARQGNKTEEIRMVFAPHQMQLASAVPVGPAHEEAKRRLSEVTQQLEILAGMPDQPWTYRKSLRMEMQRSPRPPMEHIENGKVVKTAHPLDEIRKDYFVELGKALTMATTQSTDAIPEIQKLERFARAGEPLMSHFAHYEIVRLYEMTQHPSISDEFHHRLHIVFFTTPSDASVRPVISSIDQLVHNPTLIPNEQDRYDCLNALVQKLIERWEARTAWEPRSAVRVQNDVDQSVRVVNMALEQMEELSAHCGLTGEDFRLRRRFVNSALVSPLRAYRDQVLAHRLKNEAPAEPDSEVPNDLPLMASPVPSVNTN